MPDLAADIARRVKKLSKAAVPAGGATGRVLTKTGPGDFDTGWQLAARLPTGGAVGDVLTKTALPDGAAGWAAPAAGGGFPVGQIDTYLDPTGVSIAANTTDYLPWVDAGGSPWLPSAGVLAPGTYSGLLGAQVVADGDITVKATVDQIGGSGFASAQLVLFRPPSTDLDLSIGTVPITGGPLDSSGQCFITFPCLAGDLFLMRIQTALAASTATYKLFASVKSLT